MPLSECPSTAIRPGERVVAGIAAAAAGGITLGTMGPAAGLLVVALAVAYALWVGRERWPAAARILPVYAAAVAVQCAHLAEEYASGFHRAFPPLLGAEPWSGRRFLVFNLGWLAAFAAAGVGLARGSRVAYLAALFLAIGGGIANGLGHLALSARAGGYFPGAYTGAAALLAGSLLAYGLLSSHPLPSAPP